MPGDVRRNDDEPRHNDLRVAANMTPTGLSNQIKQFGMGGSNSRKPSAYLIVEGSNDGRLLNRIVDLKTCHVLFKPCYSSTDPHAVFGKQFVIDVCKRLSQETSSHQ